MTTHRYTVTMTGRTGWDGHLTTQRYDVQAENTTGACNLAVAQAREEYQYEHANGGQIEVYERDPLIHKVFLVDIDTDPSLPVHGDLNPKYADLTLPFADALQHLRDNPEDTACANCGKGVGYVPQEVGDLERVFWDWATLINYDGGPVRALCKDCTPANVQAPLGPAPVDVGGNREDRYSTLRWDE